MIDVHSHILSGLDDGARSLEESVAMLRIAAESGTTDIVATPHANLQYAFDPERVAEKIAELAAAAGPAPRIHRGCDFHLSWDNIQRAVAEPSRFTINGGRYLLVEFPDLLIVPTAGEIFDTLRRVGIVAVITHPERNALLQQRVEELSEWVAQGCRVQVTAQSLLGRFGREARDFADLLLRRGLVHLIASDAHDAEDRTPDLSGAYGWLRRRYGEDLARQLLVENPRRVIENAPLPPAAEPLKKKWYRFW